MLRAAVTLSLTAFIAGCAERSEAASATDAASPDAAVAMPPPAPTPEAMLPPPIAPDAQADLVSVSITVGTIGETPADPAFQREVELRAKGKLAQQLRGTTDAEITWAGWRRVSWLVEKRSVTATYAIPRAAIQAAAEPTSKP
jgi:hypothetical protein